MSLARLPIECDDRHGRHLLRKHRRLERRVKRLQSDAISVEELASYPFVHLSDLPWDPDIDKRPNTTLSCAPMSEDKLSDILSDFTPNIWVLSNPDCRPWEGFRSDRDVWNRFATSNAVLDFFRAKMMDMDFRKNLMQSGGWSWLGDSLKKQYRPLRHNGMFARYGVIAVFLPSGVGEWGSHIFCVVAEGQEADDNKLLKVELLAPIRLAHDHIKNQLPFTDSPIWSIYPVQILSISATHMRIIQAHVDLEKGAVFISKTPYLHIQSQDEEAKISLVMRWLLGHPIGGPQPAPASEPDEDAQKSDSEPDEDAGSV